MLYSVKKSYHIGCGIKQMSYYYALNSSTNLSSDPVTSMLPSIVTHMSVEQYLNTLYLTAKHLSKPDFKFRRSGSYMTFHVKLVKQGSSVTIKYSTSS